MFQDIYKFNVSMTSLKILNTEGRQSGIDDYEQKHKCKRNVRLNLLD